MSGDVCGHQPYSHSLSCALIDSPALSLTLMRKPLVYRLATFGFTEIILLEKHHLLGSTCISHVLFCT